MKKRTVFLSILSSFSFVTGKDSQAFGQSTFTNETTIGGRPEAPLLQMDALPSPELPYPDRISPYPEIDYSDFVKNPNLLFLYSKDSFKFEMKKLMEEVENIAASK